MKPLDFTKELEIWGDDALFAALEQNFGNVMTGCEIFLSDVDWTSCA